MKKLLLIVLALVLVSGIATAQRGKVVTQPVTPHMAATYDNSVSSGLIVMPRQTYVYLSAKNILDTASITSATFALPVRPSGSAAVITNLPNGWASFIPDVNGAYTVGLNITTAAGSHDTTQIIYSSNFRGVGDFDGISGFGCMSCHGAGSGNGDFSAIYTRWKDSGHANMFKTMITSGPAYYNTSCIKCHTTGYDHNVVAANNGFDDVATTLGWSYVAPPNSGKWDSLKTGFPGLVKFATIGCENCHGPGSSHPGSQPGSSFKTRLLESSGNCGQCHDELPYHYKYQQWENSGHAENVWRRTSTGVNAMTNNLSDCIRCHDGQGYVNFTKGLTTNSTTWSERANASRIGCATCHDPHGNSNLYSLRGRPAGSDTLATGFQYTGGGTGRTCMDCHKARRNNETYVSATNASSGFGPHYLTSADVLLGKNAATFDAVPYQSNSHQFAVENTCVTCHMVPTVASTDSLNFNKVGGHTFTLHNPATGFDYTASCVSCHGPKTSFEDFTALMDYDGDGTVEGIPSEVEGLIRNIRIFLPPIGIDSIDYTAINTIGDVRNKKALWNIKLMDYGGGKGMHNSKYTFSVLLKTQAVLRDSVIPVELISFTSSIVKDEVVLSWETASETNNNGFEIERKTGEDWTKIGFVPGAGTTTEVMKYSYKDAPKGLSGVISYRLKQVDYDGSFTLSKAINVDVSAFTPSTYSISQNYPNPFNPSTLIKFALPFESNVKVTIYNINGEMVKELVNGAKTAGNHEVSFNTEGLNLSSGVYFYSIKASSVSSKQTFQQTKKMVLLK